MAKKTSGAALECIRKAERCLDEALISFRQALQLHRLSERDEMRVATACAKLKKIVKEIEL